MPPKKKANDPNKKTVEKAKAKVVEDKTFGMKNKKGSKQQKFIQQVHKTVMTAGTKTAKQLAKEQDEKFAKKEQKKKEALELNTLFRPVDQKIGKGVDPKSVLCAFFKAGSCGKGDKCKFSHDLNIQRKGEKRNIYDEDDKKETMEDWDEAKLEEVVNKKHGESNSKQATTTTIICKFFLEAVEESKYGWFWECPNGKDCKYRHALPPGFVLKKDLKKDDSKEEKISLEELVEKERAALNSSNLTRVTLESFMKWKERKKQEKIKAAKKSKDSRKKDFSRGNASGISGREMFEFNPDLIIDEMEGEEGDAEVDFSAFRREDDDQVVENERVVDIDLDSLAASAREADDSGTKRGEKPPADPGAQPQVNGTTDTPPPPPTLHEDESNKLSMAAGGASSEDPGLADAAAASTIMDVPIDENLFDDDDLLDIEDELEELELDA